MERNLKTGEILDDIPDANTATNQLLENTDMKDDINTASDEIHDALKDDINTDIEEMNDGIACNIDTTSGNIHYGPTGNIFTARDTIHDSLRTKRVKGMFSSTFVCQWEDYKRPGPADLLSWKRLPYEPIPSNEILDRTLPLLPVSTMRVADEPAETIRITWIGHATLLVQFDGITVLTDPHFSTCAGPLHRPFMSYNRYRPPAYRVTDIPRLDAVIISHNHYDHLDEDSIVAIHARFPGVRWFVALGMKDWLVKKGCYAVNVSELEWWEEVTFKEVRFVCTPSQHWCQLSVFDMNQCLWCSWILKGPKYTYYFSGDTGYYKLLFETIGKKYGPIHLAAITIGGYNPRFITQYERVNPEEAVQIHVDIGSQMSVGIGWGTFQLTNEPYLEPPHRLKKAMTDCDLDVSKFICLNIGETWDVGDPRDEPQFMRENVTIIYE